MTCAFLSPSSIVEAVLERCQLKRAGYRLPAAPGIGDVEGARPPPAGKREAPAEAGAGGAGRGEAVIESTGLSGRSGGSGVAGPGGVWPQAKPAAANARVAERMRLAPAMGLMRYVSPRAAIGSV